ncbi:hypothetical protein ACFOVU_00045 [Nocardiopsis sediminis]|uniref:RING-type E3 ubiquitin transferase n=1 Tax=Nocardiopsis sediminis TaxID=1778267 RepID=A0ABV8FH96_9ACTN
MDAVIASLLVGGCTLLTIGLALLPRIRTLEALPHLTVDAALAGAGQGTAVITGRAAPDTAGPLRSPLTRRPCVWWALETSLVPGPRAATLLTRRSAASAATFRLTGATGSIRVHPAGLRPHPRLVGSRTAESLAGAAAPHLLPWAAHRVAARFPWMLPLAHAPSGLEAVGVAEWLVEPGQPVTVTGHLHAATGRMVAARLLGGRRGPVFGISPAGRSGAESRCLRAGLGTLLGAATAAWVTAALLFAAGAT